jgi:hypothetical protein
MLKIFKNIEGVTICEVILVSFVIFLLVNIVAKVSIGVVSEVTTRQEDAELRATTFQALLEFKENIQNADKAQVFHLDNKGDIDIELAEIDGKGVYIGNYIKLLMKNGNELKYWFEKGEEKQWCARTQKHIDKYYLIMNGIKVTEAIPGAKRAVRDGTGSIITDDAGNAIYTFQPRYAFEQDSDRYIAIYITYTTYGEREEIFETKITRKAWLSTDSVHGGYLTRKELEVYRSMNDGEAPLDFTEVVEVKEMINVMKENYEKFVLDSENLTIPDANRTVRIISFSTLPSGPGLVEEGWYYKLSGSNEYVTSVLDAIINKAEINGIPIENIYLAGYVDG